MEKRAVLRASGLTPATFVRAGLAHVPGGNRLEGDVCTRDEEAPGDSIRDRSRTGIPAVPTRALLPSPPVLVQPGPREPPVGASQTPALGTGHPLGGSRPPDHAGLTSSGCFLLTRWNAPCSKQVLLPSPQKCTTPRSSRPSLGSVNAASHTPLNVSQHGK